MILVCAMSEELARKLGPEVAEAAFAMTAPNQLLERVVATRAGFHILRLLDREQAQEATFEQIRDFLRSRMVKTSEAEPNYRSAADTECTVCVNPDGRSGGGHLPEPQGERRRGRSHDGREWLLRRGTVMVGPLGLTLVRLGQRRG